MTVILNKTPWSTEDLEKVLLPLFTGCGIIEATIELISPHKSRWRKKDRLSRIKLSGGDARDKVVIELVSAKRAAARTETLDRLSLASDLKPHETALPALVHAHLRHAFGQLRERKRQAPSIRDGYSLRRNYEEISECLEGYCGCQVPEAIDPPLVRGDTKVRTHASPNAVSEEALLGKRRHWETMQHRAETEAVSLRAAADRADAKAAEYEAKVNKVDERIIKVKAKAAMSVPLASHQGGEELDEEPEDDEEVGDGDEAQQEDE